MKKTDEEIKGKPEEGYAVIACDGSILVSTFCSDALMSEYLYKEGYLKNIRNILANKAYCIEKCRIEVIDESAQSAMEAEIERRAKEKAEEWKKNLKGKLLELQAMAIRYNDHYGDAMIDNVLNLLRPSEGENHE